jgi:HEPN domain-containing protein
MPPDAKAEEVGQWLAKAKEDVRVAECLIVADPPMPGAVAFHCQQAVEKALKGLLIHREVRPTKTHSIAQVGVAIIDTDPDLEHTVDEADWLSPYAAEFRYPGDLSEPSVEELRPALELAREVVAKVEARVSAAT